MFSLFPLKHGNVSTKSWVGPDVGPVKDVGSVDRVTIVLPIQLRIFLREVHLEYLPIIPQLAASDVGTSCLKWSSHTIGVVPRYSWSTSTEGKV